MRHSMTRHQRPGSILPLVALCLVGLVGFTALAIDAGMLMVSRTQCQLAADAGAMAGARTLNGNVAANNNYSNAGPNTVTAATSCKVFSQLVQASNVSYSIGYYTYDSANGVFGPILPGGGVTLPSGQNWSLVECTVSATNNSAFSKIFGVSSLTTTAVAEAVHRPRDVCVVIDLSGSMSFDSLLGGPIAGSRTQSNNPDTIYPQFGHYSSASAGLTWPSAITLGDGQVVGASNTAVDTNSGSAIAADFYQNNVGASAVAAFSPSLDSYATAPGGDIPLKKTNNTAAAYATDVTDVLGSSSMNASWEANGYSWTTLHGGSAYTFKGYTTGPRYWGKTFFIWPPDPRSANDWRQKFFFASNGTSPLTDNTALWTSGSSPTANPPRTSSTTHFYINYAAILRWLINTGPNPFPSQVQAGRITFYTAFPDVSNPANDSALNSRFQSVAPADLNERFWKQYIDYVLGFQQTSGSGSSPVYSYINAEAGYGDDFNWGSPSISTKPGTYSMTYTDNPPRPKTRFWFGPMTFIDFIDNYNTGQRWMPGTVHQAPAWACKVGMATMITDIKNNHANDYACLSFFNTPMWSANDGGKFNNIIVPLGNSYTEMVDCLYYPLITVTNNSTYPSINCFDTANMLNSPRASGGTTSVMGFMQAYNQFSSKTALVNFTPSPWPAGTAGGYGRIGAQKMIIFMTDGCANQAANASFTNNGAYQSYYDIRQTSEFPTNSTGSYSSIPNQIYGVAQQICNLNTNAGAPGYATVKKPVLIHCIAFGTLFDASIANSSAAATTRNNALAILENVQFIGNTQATATTPLPSSKIIIGSPSNRITLMQQCFQQIQQSTVSITLIE